MKLKSISSSIWTDTWFEELTPSEKLLFIYLLTNDRNNMLGIYEISLKKISFETGINKEQLTKALKGFERVNKVRYEYNHIVLVNFLKHQKFNPNMMKAAIDIYNDLPNELKINNIERIEERNTKGFERLSKGLGMVRKIESERESEIEEENEDEISVLLFIDFWTEYHKITGLSKTDKESAEKKWKTLKKEEKQKAYDNIKHYYDLLSDKKYCKKARTYLADKNFNDEFKKKANTIKW